MPAPVETSHSLEGPAGVLEALLATPDGGTPRAVAVVCHPHPQHEGTMQNKVVHTLARAFVDAGMPALRFNFRGVGNSAGTYDEGVGETADAVAAAAWLQARFPGTRLWLAGFSFGAYVAVRASRELDCAGLVTVAPAVSRFDFTHLEMPGCPWLLVHGDQDEIVDVDAVVEWVNGLDPGPELTIVEGSSHFFHGRLTPLRERVTAFIAEHDDA